MVVVTRFLLLFAAVLMLPAIAAAQPTPLAVERVWTQTTGGSNKTSFAPGETIQFVAQLNNSYGGALLSAPVTITTPFYNNTKTIDIPPGVSTWTWNATAPSAEGSNIVAIKAFDSFYGAWPSGNANFTVTAKPAASGQAPAPGWYYNGAGTIPNVSPILYEDNSGLRIIWQNSYIYQYPGDSALYWYAEVLYLNVGSQPLLISCAGMNDPSLIKEHMRGTANAGSVAAEETFCSRNPTFTASLKPGESHYDWAIFHNVPWRGGEVSIEWGIYGSLSVLWVNPWYAPYPANAPIPAECPPELVTLHTCQTAEQRWQGAQPGYVCLGGSPGQQCGQPVKLIRQPIEWSQDPIKAIRESPLGPVELNNLLEQHKGIQCGMAFLPGFETLKIVSKATFTGVAVGADIFDGKLYMVPVEVAGAFVPYKSCAEVLLQRKFDPTQW